VRLLRGHSSAARAGRSTTAQSLSHGMLV
jgi:hypothetical protein